MRKTNVHRVGGVVSADIAVPDHQRELDFYSKILTTGDTPLWRNDLTNNLGEPIVGLGERTPDYELLPLQWMPHIQVADVAASAETAIKLGGKELMHGKSEDGQSQWAVLGDPFGAAFGVIPVAAGEPKTTLQDERIGCISWLSLPTPDAMASRDFYQQVVGWEAKRVETDNNNFVKYEMQIDEEIVAAEICQFENDHEGIPPVWLIHLPVDDLLESLRRVRDGGGEVIDDFNESIAIVRDPVGILFAIQSG